METNKVVTAIYKVVERDHNTGGVISETLHQNFKGAASHANTRLTVLCNCNIAHTLAVETVFILY